MTDNNKQDGAPRKKMPKWTPERRRKFKATMKAKRAGKVVASKPRPALTPILDLLTYVNKAETCLEERDLEGVALWLMHARRKLKGKE